MASIWQKTFGKFNKKKNLTRQLADTIIEFKNDIGYDTISEAIVTIGGAYEFAKTKSYRHKVYDLWGEAKEIGVLDRAVSKAIEKDKINETEDDSNSDMPNNSGAITA